MRKIVAMETACLRNGNTATDYCRRISRLVHEGFVPYGKPYTHGDYLIREFVKYEYMVDDGFEWEEGEDEEQIRPEDPWETHDFFEHIDEDFGG